MGQPAEDRLRIAHVITSDRFAGTERYVVEVSTELASRGHRIDVVGGHPERMQDQFSGTAVRWRPGSTAMQTLQSLIRAGRRDITHSHITKADFVAAMTAPLGSGKLVSTRHITARRGYSKPAARLATLIRRMQACEVAVSQFVADSVETKVDAVLLNGVRATEDRADPPRDKVVLVAQRLAAEKCTDLALQAWAESGLGHDGWRLVIAGDGEQREALTAQAMQLGVLPSVCFLGWVDDLSGHLDSAALLLATAPAEPCGLTVLEAMAHGLAVVAAGAGGHLETLGRASQAAFFEPGDVSGAARQLRRLAEDDTMRLAYGQQLRSIQRADFTLQTHVDQLEKLYRQARG